MEQRTVRQHRRAGERHRCRVRITKAESVPDEQDESQSNATNEVAAAPAADEELETIDEFDVRELPPAQRHEQIFEAYAEFGAVRRSSS